LNDNQQQVLNDIQSLQKIEQDLFHTLETSINLSQDEYNKIINKINSISQMRINLYKTFGNFNNLYANTLINSQTTIQQQAFAIGIIEKQLNDAKTQLQKLEANKNNTIRLIEINDYYGEKYNEHASLMKYIIFTLFPIIILFFLFNKGFLPNTIFYILLFIITVIGSIFIITRLVSIWSRDNMNYQEYTWGFNMKNAPTAKSQSSINDPWLTTKSSNSCDISETCIGSDCCTTGMIYDSDLKQCIANSSTSSKESFMNSIFTKESFKNKKPDFTINSYVMPSNY
jgi:hypothetical protein